MLKQESPGDIAKHIEALESRADQCFDHLAIYSLPKGFGAWLTLSFLEALGAQSRAGKSPATNAAALMNLGRRGALMLRWIRERASLQPCSLEDYVWSSEREHAVVQAWQVASNYLPFTLTFPMWHQNRVSADLLSDTSVRCSVPGGSAARRVSAFHKGLRPESHPPSGHGLELSAEQLQAIRAVQARCVVAGPMRMTYAEPLELYRFLRPAHERQLSALFRRDDALDLGPYNVGDLKRVYSALLAVCATHEHLSATWGGSGAYPIDSCVIVRPTTGWNSCLADASEVDRERVEAIVRDLTISENYVVDLHVQPFVPVDDDALAVAPQFVLNSRADENAVRVCGRRRKDYFDLAASMKEREMLNDLLEACPTRFHAAHGIGLPSTLPDIDLLLSDEAANAVIVAELKWLRKPLDWRERIDRSKDFAKGVRQLESVRRFLSATPSYLKKRGLLARALDSYTDVRYLLVARDEFQWCDVTDGLVVEFDVFKETMRTAEGLDEALRSWTSYSWLPKEGRDFIVKFEPASANGVTIETEVFYGCQ